MFIFRVMHERLGRRQRGYEKCGRVDSDASRFWGFLKRKKSHKSLPRELRLGQPQHEETMPSTGVLGLNKLDFGFGLAIGHDRGVYRRKGTEWARCRKRWATSGLSHTRKDRFMSRKGRQRRGYAGLERNGLHRTIDVEWLGLGAMFE